MKFYEFVKFQGVADRISDCRSRLLPGGLATARPTVYQRPLGANNLGRTTKKPGLSPSHGSMGSSSGGGKSKRVRTIFTPEQLERLEAEFERQQYMVGPERLYLAHTLQLTEAQVKVKKFFLVAYKILFPIIFSGVVSK